MIRSVILFLIEILLIFGLIAVSYSLATPYITDTENDVLTNCTPDDNSHINLSENKAIQVENSVSTEGIKLTIPNGTSTSLQFKPMSDVTLLNTNNVEQTDKSNIVITSENKSTITYTISDTNDEYSNLGLTQSNNYTILPETSNNITYDITKTRNPSGRLVYLGENYTSETIHIGCQEVNYFTGADTEIDTYENTLKKVAGKIPFEQKYETVNIFLIETISSEDRFEGKASGNDITIEKSNNNEVILLHEYIHTFQSYDNLSENKSESWYIEGTTQYYTSKLRYEAGLINKYEHLSEVNAAWQSKSSTNTEKAYNADSPIQEHYTLGPRIIHDYQTTEPNQSLETYYQNYEANGHICDNIKCKAFTTFYTYIYSLRIDYPLFYYGLYAIFILGTIDVIRRRKRQITTLIISDD